MVYYTICYDIDTSVFVYQTYSETKLDFGRLNVKIYDKIYFFRWINGVCIWKQECIPAWCVPSAAVVSVGGVSQHALDEGCIQACTGQGVCVQGVSAQEGVSDWGSVCPGRCLPQPLLTSVNRMTDARENITLPQLRCGRQRWINCSQFTWRERYNNECVSWMKLVWNQN